MFGKKNKEEKVDAVLNESKDWDLKGYFFADDSTSHIGLDMEEVSEYYAGKTVEINFNDGDSATVEFDAKGNPIAK